MSKSVVVCASKRYADEVKDFCMALKDAGILVFEPDIYESLAEDIEMESAKMKHDVFTGLTLKHFDWIRKADVCFVYNKDNYIGTSVTLEMGYATALGKPLFCLSSETGDPCTNALVDKAVTSAQELIDLLM